MINKVETKLSQEIAAALKCQGSLGAQKNQAGLIKADSAKKQLNQHINSMRNKLDRLQCVLGTVDYLDGKELKAPNITEVKSEASHK